MDVLTDHQIVAFGPDKMLLFSCGADAAVIAQADRTAGVWTITATNVADVSANSRADAITALTDQALAALTAAGGTAGGYSTTVPHGLTDLP
jgi:hypothetical protein